MANTKKLTQQNFDAIRNHLFDRIHKTGEEIKNDFPNLLRRAIETEAWEHFTDVEGKPFNNLVDWLTYTFPNGASMGEGKNAISYDEAIQLCEGHPEVRRVLAENAPKKRVGRKKAGGQTPTVRTELFREGARKNLLRARLAQDKPEFLAALERGEYGSVLAAAEAAGLVKRSKDPLPRLKSIWKRAKKKDREAFLKWIKDERK